jgi:hypothetical protein
MATAPPPPTSSTNTGKNRTLITITALIGIVVVVVLLALYGKKRGPRQRLEELHLQHELRRSAYRRRRKEQQDRGITPTMLQFIPTVKYNGSSIGERQTKSLDVEKGHAEGAAQTWSLAQSQLNIKALQMEMNQVNRDGEEKFRSVFEEQECPICTQPFIQDEDVRVLPCRHIHHKRCIDPWLLGFSGTCPVWSVLLVSFARVLADTHQQPCAHGHFPTVVGRGA